ncbi:MAG: hypothetical protein IKF39_04915, partial [Oscillospiraceae bacterium]|nr:hypothetical protein [Oscillospiraceae bacterium]
MQQSGRGQHRLKEAHEEGSEVTRPLKEEPFPPAITVILIDGYSRSNKSNRPKYNANNDKGDLPIFGFKEDDESWEILNNTSDRVLWKSDDFSTIIQDEDGKEIPEWTQDFESRYPEDYFDATQLQEFATWLKSTDQEQATGTPLPSPVVYNGTQYTNDTAAYRLAKFKAELADYVEMDSTFYYYIFTELFLMVDSRAKNAFPSFIGSA